MKRKLALGLVAVAASACSVLGMTGSAYAAGPGGAESCPGGTVCLYYNSPGAGWGSSEHWPRGEYNLFNCRFTNWGNGSGYNQVVGDNAAAVVNNTGSVAYVCNGGGCLHVNANSSGGLGAWQNADWTLNVTG
ncbi:hypothetical protein [Streptacidiphilus sp. EB129]|uniref:hypothetical protein n=1 Tax=Streptacidiphilus sp. EB129 TaxID=3156262 RepID=UPI003511CDB7